MLSRLSSRVTTLPIVIGVALTAAAIAVVAGSLAGGASTSGQPANKPQISTLGDVRLAERVGSKFGNRRPEYLLAANSMRGKTLSVLFSGERVSGPDVDSRAPVHVVALHGHFVDYAASPPTTRHLHSHPPRGTWLVLVIDRATGRVVDLELGNKHPQLKRLGRVSRTAMSPS